MVGFIDDDPYKLGQNLLGAPVLTNGRSEPGVVERMFMTPIAYPSSLLTGKWRIVYGLNPMAGVVEAFRWGLLGTKTAPSAMIAICRAVSVVLLAGGAYYFRRMEKTSADAI